MAAVLLVGAAATTASAAPAPSTPTTAGDGIIVLGTAAAVDVGAFYSAPDPLPVAAPGTIIRSEEIAAPPNARGWRVLYHSRDIHGNDIAVSGTVFAPEGRAPKRGRPVVAWAHGTTGIGDACAPSRHSAPTAAITWLADLLRVGYVVTATDYPGLGTAGVHPYLVGESEGRAVLDSIRAARLLPTRANRTAAVYGHSQGGHAALFAGEIAAQYAPDLSVRAIAAGAPAVDPAALVDDYIARYDNIGFLVLGALGYQAAYPELAAAPVLTSADTPGVDVTVHSCATEVMATFAGVDPATVFRADPRTLPAWQARVRENTAGLRRSVVPVLYWQGTADDITAPAPADAYRDRACDLGTTLDYRLYEGADHGTVITTARADVLRFLERSFAGDRVAGNCPDAARSRAQTGTERS